LIEHHSGATPAARGEESTPHPADRKERRAASAGNLADSPSRRVLVVAPQPFYEDRGTPIAVRQVLQALGELGRPVDLLTFPIGTDVAIPGLRIFRSGNPLGFHSVRVGFSVRKLVLDLPLTWAFQRRVSRERYACIHAVEEAAFPAAVLARRHGVPLLYDMQSSLAEQLACLRPLGFAPARAALNAMERWLLRRSSMVVTSAGLAERVRAMVPEVPVREWYYASAPADSSPEAVQRLRAALGLASKGPVVLYSGTFEAYQGLPQLIAAIPAAQRPGRQGAGQGDEQSGPAYEVEMEGKEAADDGHEQRTAADAGRHRDDTHQEADQEQRERPDPPGRGRRGARRGLGRGRRHQQPAMDDVRHHYRQFHG